MATIKKKIVVIGSEGVVGSACVRFFNLRKDIYDVYRADILPHDKVKGLNDGDYCDVSTNNPHREEVNKMDLAVVCVPTPQGKTGVDLTAVHEVFKWLKVPLVLIKSTIPPLEMEKLKTIYGRVVYSPEYIGESKYYIPDELMHKDDMVKLPYYIFGGDPKDCSEIIDYYVPIAGPTKMYFRTDIKTASLVKYFENIYFATKVTFCQEMYEVAKVYGVDYHELRELWLLDPRIGRMHSSVFKNNRGFGGKCFPKDLDGLIKEVDKVGYSCDLLKQVQKSNEIFKSKNETK